MPRQRHLYGIAGRSASALRRAHQYTHLGIDTPQLNGQCEPEKSLAQQAKALIERTVRHAKQIEITDVLRDKQFRILGRVIVDGEDLGSKLLAAGLAVPDNAEAEIKDGCQS